MKIRRRQRGNEEGRVAAISRMVAVQGPGRLTPITLGVI